MFWKQRSKVHWLRDGDQNTHFFHAMASSRKKKNTLQKLIEDHGNTASNHDELCVVACAYFANLFTAQKCDPSIVTSLVDSCIDEADNSILLAPFVIGEFRATLMSMNPNSSLVPDGINPAFYKRLWDLAGNEIFNACCS